MRYLSDAEASGVRRYLARAYELARSSDCKEAQYGAVIFKGDTVLGEGFNHVADILKPKYSCDECPRRRGELHKGVGLELCISVHAEEDAVDDLIIRRGHKIEESRGANIIIARLKEGAKKVPKELSPYCTKCSGSIAVRTQLGEVMFETESGIVAFGRPEFHEKSIENLYSNWKESQRSIN
ncbi:MAG: hypothetical protein KGH59_00640 [Candidatus Micrarchaeota archaeon]|nr:hypothetical protein [Candidatus Micrarchaeota archaeon]MDE1804279.1 hypothetical protein [Candidatus Micrarchaeota archaeon]MDE1846844.1 hypothetical protein [Candidatus Micrarchaeota archaeon]